MKYALLLTALVTCLDLWAQDPSPRNMAGNPVSWTFHAEKAGPMYIVSATAAIQHGWHVFTTQPGGDGLLIPTELVVNEIKHVKDGIEFKEEGEVVSREIEGIGKVNFYENTTTFKFVFPATKSKTYTGYVIYQVCNDKTCLAPAQVPFSVTIK